MIIFDASTLILLAKIDLLEPFISSVGEKVVIPEKVQEEVAVKELDEALLIAKLIREKKLKVLRVKSRKFLKKLMDDFHIDIGEAEAITLALQEGTSLVATDDRNAIRACKMLKIEFTTAISILIRAYEKSLIDKEDARIKLHKLTSAARYNRAILENAQEMIEGGK